MFRVYVPTHLMVKCHYMLAFTKLVTVTLPFIVLIKLPEQQEFCLSRGKLIQYFWIISTPFKRSPARYFDYVCLFRGFLSYSRIFHSYGDVTITTEWQQILTYAPHSWPWQHLLWQGPILYNCHLRGPETLTPVA